MLMNDPEYFEKFRNIDTINDYNLVVEEYQKRISLFYIGRNQ